METCGVNNLNVNNQMYSFVAAKISFEYSSLQFKLE